MDGQPKEQTEQSSLAGCPESLLPVLKGLRNAFPEAGFGTYFFRGEATVTVFPEKVIEVLAWLKQTPEHAFDYLLDIGGLHNPGEEREIVVFYNLLSITTNRRLRIKTWAAGDPPTVRTATGLWEAANWHEREAYDMFGIHFEGHPDLRRMFLPEHVDFHPLRKEYPLRGDNDKPTF